MSSNIYTKVGDKGETSLLSGTKVFKSDLRLEMYGTLDELNSWLGLIICRLKMNKALIQEEEFLEMIQNSLFDLGSLLACEKEKQIRFSLTQLPISQVLEMEARIDKIETSVGVLKNFIIPGGGETASFTHLARTVCRRCERLMVRFEKECKDELPENALIFINRFSDYLFILGRLINKIEGHPEILWKKHNE